MQNGDNIRRITDELLSDVAEDGVKYIEIRFAPRLHMAKGLTFDEIVESVLSAIRTAPEKYGIYANLILCCMRHEDVKHSIEVVKSGRKFLGKGVVAVDLAGNEHDYPPELHKAALILQRTTGITLLSTLAKQVLAKMLKNQLSSFMQSELVTDYFVRMFHRLMLLLNQNKYHLKCAR